jgi:Tol biopolymer transport system component
MGIVYRAHDLKLGRMVALKRPKPEVMALPDFTKRFLREARTSSRLLHPNITTVFAAYEQDGVPWLVMELVEGASLRDRLSRGGRLPVGEIIEHAEGLADALRASHEQGILHSDVNPNNILIGRDGRARLTDFGLARARNAPGGAPVFGDGDVPTWSTPEAAGTRGYMAPEHLRGRGLDPRSDLYCLGLVLFEMCVGKPVFAGKNTVEWVGAAMDGETELLAKLGPEVPPELARIIARATATEPKRRYQSAAEMVGDLRALRRFRESGVEIAVADAARARKRTHYGVLAAVVVLAVVAVALLIGLRSRMETSVLNPRRLTRAPGWEAHPALSPDGTMVAYSSNESGNDDIWLVSVAAGDSRQLTVDPSSDSDPAWFPNGQTIAFTSNRSGVPAVWVVPTSGGSARLVIANASEPDVSPDGTLLAVAARQPDGLTRIAVAPIAEPGRLRLISPGDGFWEEREPDWSPDGRWVAYTDFRDIWVVGAAGGLATRLTSDEGVNREPAWSPDGRSIVCSSSRQGERALWRLRVPRGGAVRLTAGTEPEVQPSLSKLGARLVYATQRESTSIEIRDRADRTGRSIPVSAFARMPAVDPGGRFVVFVGERLGKFGLWRKELADRNEETPPRCLLELPGTVAKPAVTPDGRFVAFHRVVNGERDIWAVPSLGGVATPLIERQGVDIHPAFSSDGTRMAFISDTAGEQHLWTVGFSDGRVIGEPRQVTSGPGTDLCPSWSPDDTRIAFIRHLGEDADVWIADHSGREPARRVTRGENVDLLQWEPHQDAILASCRRRGRNSELRRIALADGRNEPVVPAVTFGGPDYWGAFSASADGRLLAVAVSETTGDIWLTGTGP